MLSCADSQHKIVNKETITVKDYFDKDIELPIKVNRIMTMTSVTAEMICVVGASEKIVGIGKINVNRSPIIDNYFPVNQSVAQFQYIVLPGGKILCMNDLARKYHAKNAEWFCLHAVLIIGINSF